MPILTTDLASTWVTDPKEGEEAVSVWGGSR